MPTDAELLTGDARRFAAFYRRHEDAMLGYFLKRVRSAELAADLTAETFARALEGRARFDRGRGDAGAWLFGIAHNVLTRSLERGRVEDDVRRRLAMQPLVLDDEAIASIETLDDEPALAALAALPEDQADAIRRRVIDEVGYEELAQRLDCSPSVVRQRVSRGLRAMRAELGDDR
jgi:RNA polymerase sigma-70 factor (ECF subfamily)